MALRQKTGTRITSTGTRRTVQKTRTESAKQNLPYLTLRNLYLELPQEELSTLATEEQEEHTALSGASVPEDEEDESWEPDEEEHLSDDWDLLLVTARPGDEVFDAPEPDPLFQTADAAQIVTPAVLVDCEQTPTGPELIVRLADYGVLYSLMQMWRQSGQLDRASALAYRLTRLLEFSRYVVAQQRDFFLRQGPRKPLTAVHVATTLWPEDNWESKKGIVSRLVSGKGLRTPWDEVLRLEDVLPSNADCVLEHVCAILREHDRVELQEGKVVVAEILPVDSFTGNSLIHELQRRWQQWLGTTDGLSAENVKHVMKRHNIPRVASERRAAYESGTAWWMGTP